MVINAGLCLVYKPGTRKAGSRLNAYIADELCSYGNCIAAMSGKTSDAVQFKLLAVKAAEKKSKEAGNKIPVVGWLYLCTQFRS